jgi:plasmid maintenance system antidote protein VapI
MREPSIEVSARLALEELSKPPGIAQYRLAKQTGVPQRRIGEMAAAKRSSSTAMAERSGVFSALAAGFRFCLQSHYEPAQTRKAIAGRRAEMQSLSG